MFEIRVALSTALMSATFYCIYALFNLIHSPGNNVGFMLQLASYATPLGLLVLSCLLAVLALVSLADLLCSIVENRLRHQRNPFKNSFAFQNKPLMHNIKQPAVPVFKRSRPVDRSIYDNTMPNS